MKRLSWVPAKAHAAWLENCEMFLRLIAPSQRPQVERVLQEGPQGSGKGIRFWLEAIAFRRSPLPDRIPSQLIEAYFCDPEAEPLHQCEECGIAIPVRPNRFNGAESEPELIYFERCPVCNSSVRQYLFRPGNRG